MVSQGLFTVANPNSPKSVEIGKTELSALASSCGLTELKNTEQLRGIRFNGVVKINDNGYAELDPAYGKTLVEQSKANLFFTKNVAAPKPVEVDPLDSEEIPF